MPTNSNSNQIPELLTTKELAKRLNISESTVHRLKENGTISFYKIRGAVRFKMEDVLAYLQKTRVESVGMQYLIWQLEN